MNLLVIENLENEEQQQLFNNRRNPHNPFEELSERHFINMFRVSKVLCNYIIECVEPHMRPKSRLTDLDISTRVYFHTGIYGPY